CCGFRVHLPDFDNLSVSAASRESALEAAGVLLLRTLAKAAQRGERVPRPGDLPEGKHERVMIHPLLSAA
ncbi:integrase, partial [Salmonella enterica subsp. enterica serovar Typhi]|nr:integrase [Salmonella enterica subsp. enterica serovar Typhi]